MSTRVISPKPATIVPRNIPKKKPLQVFPSPNILLPRHDLPKSIGVPPPKIAAQEFDVIAGNSSQKAVPKTSTISTATNLLAH